MRKSIAFDLDGTLIDVSKRDYQIYADLVNKLGGTPLSYPVYWPLRQAKTDIHQVLADSHITSDEHIDVFLVERKALMESMEYLSIDVLFPDSISVLDKLSKDFDIHILTIRHNKLNIESQLRSLGLERYHCHIVSGNKVEQLRLIPHIDLMVGDTENDILPANTLGIKSVAVTTGIRNRQLLSEMNPTYIVDGLGEIENLLYGRK